MTDTRWTKLHRRLSEGGASEIPAWFAKWAYWNSRAYRVPGVPRLRTVLKEHKANKKFGIDAPIVVYQMGKVGSASVHARLHGMDLDVPVFHAHALKYLNDEAQGLTASAPEPVTALHLPHQERELWRLMQQGRWKNWTLIALVRAPVPRSISVFFHRLYLNWSMPNPEARRARNEITVADLLERFSAFEDPVPQVWFEQQVQEMFGIDVYAKPFDRERGYELYAHGNVRLMVIRLEDANRRIAPAMQELLGLTDFQLATRNVSESGPYGAMYQEFLASLRLPAARVEAMHATHYARHFYTSEELSASVARWVNGAGAGS